MTAILCPDCNHSINAHVFEFDFEQYFCGGTYGDCGCCLSPSDIARALMARPNRHPDLIAAAPRLLAALADEVERLRAEKAAMSEAHECACFVDGCPCTTTALDQEDA